MSMDKYIQQSSSLFGSLKNAVLGNPVTREFTIGEQIASFGPGLLWKVFDGKKKSTGQVSRFMKWDKVFKNGPSKIFGRQPLKKVVFHKFYLVFS